MMSIRRSPGRRATILAVCGVSVLGIAVPSSVVVATPVAGDAQLARASFVGLGQGASGDDVAALQAALMEAGAIVKGGADGVFGPATRAAVIWFQKQNGLPATGVIDAATEQSLSNPAAAGSGGAGSQGTTSSAFVGMSEGASGDLAKQVQQALIDIGVFVPGGADGNYGAATAEAVRQFQRWNGLEVTGTITQATARLLKLEVGGSSAAGGGSGSAGADEEEATSDAGEYVGLSLGASGARVRELQSALIAAGVTVLGGADGSFGPATQGALKAFQWKQGRSQTGVVTADDATDLSLGSNAGGTPTGGGSSVAAGSNPYVGLTIGDEGALVTEVQKALQGFGFVIRGGANGVFGASTKSTLMAFQSVNGIPRTGVVTEKGAVIMKLGRESSTGSGGAVGVSGSGGGGSDDATPPVTLDRFPVQGLCFYGDTWHAPRSGGRLHEGVDIIAKEGQLLYAVSDGTISKMYWDYPGARAGNGLRLAQPDGTYFTYLHLSGFAPGIEVGTKVEAGDVIGFVGNTGSSATAHLHFEIHPRGGAPVNPYPYVKAIDDCKNTTPQFQQSFPGPPPAEVSPVEAATAEIGLSD